MGFLPEEIPPHLIAAIGVCVSFEKKVQYHNIITKLKDIFSTCYFIYLYCFCFFSGYWYREYEDSGLLSDSSEYLMNGVFVVL